MTILYVHTQSETKRCCLDEQWIVASRNVIVRLHGTSGRDEALLINAHYGKEIKISAGLKILM